MDPVGRIKLINLDSLILQEDEAIDKLVDKYGTKRWTYIALKLKEDYRISRRTGKQCRER